MTSEFFGIPSVFVVSSSAVFELALSVGGAVLKSIPGEVLEVLHTSLFVVELEMLTIFSDVAVIFRAYWNSTCNSVYESPWVDLVTELVVIDMLSGSGGLFLKLGGLDGSNECN